MDKFQDILSKVESMTVLELSELVKALEEKFGVSAAAMSVAAPGAGGGAAAEAKSTVSVVLKSGGDQKVNVIKMIKEITGLGLKEAKDLVEGAPKVVKPDLKVEEAEEMKKKLEEIGAIIELQ